MNTGFSSGYVRLLERYADLMHKMQADISGLAISERYFNKYGREMLGKFSGYESDIAVGLLGEGSDVLGYDDIYSRDHDFGAGFAIFISRKTYSEIGAELEAAYDACQPTAAESRKHRKNLTVSAGALSYMRIFFAV